MFCFSEVVEDYSAKLRRAPGENQKSTGKDEEKGQKKEKER